MASLMLILKIDFYLFVNHLNKLLSRYSEPRKVYKLNEKYNLKY